MAKLDPAVFAHLEWLGFVRPTGLVVSAPALVRAGAILDRRDAEGQYLLNSCVKRRVFDADDAEAPFLPDFRTFAEAVLGWRFSPKGYTGMAESPIPSELEVVLDEYDETLRPDYAVRELEPADGQAAWQLLVKVLEPGEQMDRVVRGRGGLEASAHGRMERLLRQTEVPAGLLFNGRALRLVSAPRGESSGWIDFQIADMVETAGRPISSALRLLLNERRLLALPYAQRLAGLLETSRRFQNEVSERLAEQVLHALYELLRGLQAAHDASKGELLRKPLAEHPDEIYRALLTVILRLVFLFYAEERDMLPEDDTYLQHYSLTALYERLREDAALFPDTMDQRYGAWAQLLVLFRLVYDGADAAGMRLPKRHGALFDPDRFRFLEGRLTGARQVGERVEPPRIPDGTIYRALEKLLVLDGERISYRALDVEEIGSVYETMMGFRLETASGRSVAIKPQKKRGAPTAVDLETLLAEPGDKREKWLRDRTDRKLGNAIKTAVEAAITVDDLHAALQPVIDRAATPDVVSRGAMVLQPSEERRRSGSHYTPRALTEPIVRTTLEPILLTLRGPNGEVPAPAAILDLKVCDPAMGSGAFLVEACRQLGDALVEAWHAHDEVPAIPPDEDELVFARRLVAQRCLFGVDRNPVAVDLAKVSLWLVTLAREHALTFVDHALRHGDSLVGLSRAQIESFHWDTRVTYESAFRSSLRQQLETVAELRKQIRDADDATTDADVRDLWDRVQFEIRRARLYGDLVVAAFFAGDTAADREAKRNSYVSSLASETAEEHESWLTECWQDDPPLAPFHWEIEFPEVFDRSNPGFDGIVGNPPFMGGRNISGILTNSYLAWLTLTYPRTGGQADLVAYFFRRAFDQLRREGCFGLIATNTIAQGDTRRAGLANILLQGGEIYAATRRLRWPGQAAVVVSVVHLMKLRKPRICILDGKIVEEITAFLVHAGGSDDPKPLAQNEGIAFTGGYPYGAGFIFDDDSADATPLAVMHELVRSDPRNAERIFPYIGGAEFLNDPLQKPKRFVINFGESSEEEAGKWPDLYRIVETKVKPERQKLADNADGRRRKKYWWQWGRFTPTLDEARGGLKRVLMHPFTSANLAFAFVGSDVVVASPHPVFTVETLASFAVLQCNVHETWVRFFGSTFKDDLRYTASDCFDTFPVPDDWQADPNLEAAGRIYYEFRAALMVRKNEGLTKTYNRFHNPEERDEDILRLRELHTSMDQAVLQAYGWADVPTKCEFLLDYEVDEDDGSRKKKPWRYRWPDTVHDDVLARLLELNSAYSAANTGLGATQMETLFT